MASGNIMPSAFCLGCRTTIEGDYVMVYHGFKKPEDPWNFYLCGPCADRMRSEVIQRGYDAEAKR